MNSNAERLYSLSVKTDQVVKLYPNMEIIPYKRWQVIATKLTKFEAKNERRRLMEFGFNAVKQLPHL